MRPLEPIWTRGVRREVLSNGLTLLVQRDDSAPVAAVVTHIKAGFFDEPDRWTGISHVLEHMFFKGTPRRGVGAIARETKSAGGYLNASTTYDHTTYLTVLPASGLATALDIQADALRHPLIDPGELARELQVIIQEAKRKLDTPSAMAYETLHEVMFDRHRMRRWRIGHEAQLAGFTREDVHGYYRTRYVPSRSIVAIVGDVDPEEALDLARRVYEDWPAAEGAVDPSPEEPPRREVRARTLRGDITQAELALGWRTVPPLHPDSSALDLAAAVLAAGRGSWLYRALREPGLVTWVAGHNYAPTEVGVFGIAAELEAGRLPEVIAGIAEATARLTMLGPTGEQLERARTLLQARWARRLEAMQGRAGALAAAEALEHFTLLDREYAELASVSADQVRHAAARYLQPDAVSAVAYLPEDEGADLTADGLARAFAVTELRPAPVITAVAPPRRAPAPATGTTEGGVLVSRLPGVDILVRRKPGVPLVTLGMYAPKHQFDPPSQAGLGALLVRSAVRGAGGLDSSDLAYVFERLGGSLAASATSDWMGFGTSILAEHLGEAATLLDTVFTAPRLADSDVAAERGLLIAEAEQAADDMFRYPFQLAFSEAFGEEGYGIPVNGLPHTLPACSTADVRAWHRQALLGVRPVVLAVGDIDPQRGAEELAGIFGDRNGGSAGPGEIHPLPWAAGAGGEPPIRVVGREKAQAALAMAFPGPARRDPDRTAAEVWAAIASGLGGRLFEALRDRRSLAYTVLATAWQKARAGALLTYIATSPEREEEAREQMLAELERFTREPVSESELRQAVNFLAGQAKVSRQNTGAVVGEILDAWISGSGLGELEDPAARFRAVTSADVLQVAAEHLVPDRRAEGVVRGTGDARAPAVAAMSG